jgi:hypothetical protein
MSAVELPKAALALYSNVNTREPGTSEGRKSLGQYALVSGFVQVLVALPFNP